MSAKLATGGVLVAYLASALAASAQLNDDQRRCIDRYNAAAVRVARAQVSASRNCVRAAGKGLEPNPQACLQADPMNKIATAAGKLDAVVQMFCDDPGGTPIVIDAATASAAHRQGVVDVVRDLFGADLNAANVVNPGTAEARCQEHAARQALQLLTAELKEFRGCKRAGLKAGSVTNEASLAATCMSDASTDGVPDPKGVIAKKAAKLASAVGMRCSGLTTPLDAVFVGQCSSAATPAALADCIERQTHCRVCQTINRSDGTARDCDLFDDGSDNDSCADLAAAICPLGPGSELQLNIVAIPVPISFPLFGAVEFRGGSPQADGTGTAACELVGVNALTIPSVGVMCLAPGSTCPDGVHDCDGGAPFGIDVHGDADLGSCTSNAACDASCDGFCAGSGAVNGLGTGCTGFCSGGAEGACSSDAQCQTPPNAGACNGPDPVLPSQNHICQCTCVDDAGGLPGVAGALQCRLPVSLQLEATGPCDGADPVVVIGDGCLPLTTEGASAIIDDANFQPGVTLPGFAPATLSGEPMPCAELVIGEANGVAVGFADFYGTALGDIVAGVKLNCSDLPAPATRTPTPSATHTFTAIGTPTNTGTVTPTPTITPTPTDTPFGSHAHLCTLQPSSKLSLHIAALAVPLQFPLNGSLSPRVGAVAGDGTGMARCDDFNIAPVNIPCIGVVCLSPQPGCPDGQRDCDGGATLGVATAADGDIGTCTGNADCQASCATHCSGLGLVDAGFSSGCVGFCSGGAMQPCTIDADCLPNDGACNGPDPAGVHAGICQCNCIDLSAGGASPAGALQCRLGLNIGIYANTTCAPAAQTIAIGNACLPVTTEAASGIITDANFNGSSVPAIGAAELAGSRTTCSAFDSSVTDGLRAVGTGAFFGSALGDILVGVELNCPGAVVPTVTATRTSTPAATATITPTPTISRTPTESGTATPAPPGSNVHTCAFAPSSSFSLNIAGLPVPLTFPISGALDVNAFAPAGSGVGNATCQLQYIDPINIPAVGTFCLAPGAAACATGARDCDGGTPLGIDLFGDGDVGTCASNAACQTTCDSYCAGTGRTNLTSGSGCTGFCSGGAMACTSDADCQPSNGACKGPEPIGSAAGVCQCNCIDSSAGGPSAAGDIQCQLPMALTLEAAAPCGDGDVIGVFGDSCVALTTQTAVDQILDANRAAMVVVPGMPINVDGAPIDCATLDTSVATGMHLVGVTNVMNTALGDSADSFSITCQ